MASIDGLPLELEASGGVVFLRESPTLEWTEQLVQGVNVRVSPISRALRVENISEKRSLDDLVTVVREAADRALDLMAIRSVGAYALEGVGKPQFVWVNDSGRVALRTSSDLELTFSARAGGNPAPVRTRWHESMRFFRMSQTSGDLFDAFRNVFLALESILTNVEPKGREREGAWLERALHTAAAVLTADNPSMTFDRYLPPGVEDSDDPVGDVFTDLWVKIRNSIFHAKEGLAFALPQSDADRATVAEALQRYAGLYADLAEVVLKARFLRSGVGPAVAEGIGVDLMGSWVVG
jgi:hypothetical protein